MNTLRKCFPDIVFCIAVISSIYLMGLLAVTIWIVFEVVLTIRNEDQIVKLRRRIDKLEKE